MTAQSNSQAGPRRKTPRSCATCHARKVKCDLLKVCTACKRHARSTGRDESTIVCVYSTAPPVAAEQPTTQDGNISSTSTSSGSSSKFVATRKERKLDQDIDYDYQQSDYGASASRTSKRRRKATANAFVKVKEEGEYVPAGGMGCGRDARRSPASSMSDNDYFSLHLQSSSDLISPPNEFLPTPTASPTLYAYPSYPSSNRPPSMTRIDSSLYIPIFSPAAAHRRGKMAHSPSVSMTLAPFDFNTFQSQPYDSPIGDFNFDFAASEITTPRLPGATPSLMEKSFNFKVEVSHAYPSPPAWST